MKGAPAVMGGDPNTQASVALGRVQFSPGSFFLTLQRWIFNILRIFFYLKSNYLDAVIFYIEYVFRYLRSIWIICYIDLHE